MTQGFITIATGKEEYYRLADNLLRSYRYFSKEPLPFAILADRETVYTENFDDIIIFPEGATNSYLDKLSLAEYAPFDETIFIDADCLAYGDLNKLFTYFRDADDFSCFGRVLPLEDKTGWFEYENLGELQQKVSYVVGLHGGIYYMRKGETSRKIMKEAKGFIQDYPKFKFKGNFSTPGDEPLVALAMAVNGCRPIPFEKEAICCYWEHADHMNVDISKGEALVVQDPVYSTILLHWGTRYTRELEYQKQLELLEILENHGTESSKQVEECISRYNRLIRQQQMKRFAVRAKNKLLRMMRMKK